MPSAKANFEIGNTVEVRHVIGMSFDPPMRGVIREKHLSADFGWLYDVLVEGDRQGRRMWDKVPESGLILIERGK